MTLPLPPCGYSPYGEDTEVTVTSLSIGRHPPKVHVNRIYAETVPAGFLYVRFGAADCGRIVFSQMDGERKFSFNQTAFGLDDDSDPARPQKLAVREAICRRFAAKDDTPDIRPPPGKGT